MTEEEKSCPECGAEMQAYDCLWHCPECLHQEFGVEPKKEGEGKRGKGKMAKTNGA